jgi:hypothetical protein
MKRILVCLTITFSTAAAAAPMSRVVGVRDSRTIIVDTKGVTSTVVLNSVSIAPEEEAAAAEYLRRIVANQWVLVDNGDVYRSPDALYVNADMNKHPWRMMRFLGEVDLGPRAKGQPPGTSVKAPAMPPPLKNPLPPKRVTQSRRGKGASR